jgi:poly(3-hydroxybutyrate) depolymerase
MCWNWFEEQHHHRDRGEPGLIAALTCEVIDEHAIDASRVYVAGLSAGGAMAAVMGAEYPDLYAAVGVHSGLPHAAARDYASALEAMSGRGSGRHAPKDGRKSVRSIPTIAFHGDEDRTVHPSNSDFVRAVGARVAIEEGQRNGRSFTRTVQLDAEGRPSFEQWVVHGAGHAWFGGSPGASFADPLGPDASREMLRFFFSHAR